MIRDVTIYCFYLQIPNNKKICLITLSMNNIDPFAIFFLLFFSFLVFSLVLRDLFACDRLAAFCGGMALKM